MWTLENVSRGDSYLLCSSASFLCCFLFLLLFFWGGCREKDCSSVYASLFFSGIVLVDLDVGRSRNLNSHDWCSRSFSTPAALRMPFGPPGALRCSLTWTSSCTALGSGKVGAKQTSPKWNPGKRQHGLKPVVPWWSSFFYAPRPLPPFGASF